MTEFDGKFYLQVKGTAMGKSFALAYANIYVAYWEETVFPKCRKLPMQYWRYLDNVWVIWEGTEKELREFVEDLNQHCSSIWVKWELKEHEISLLDTITYKGPGFFLKQRIPMCCCIIEATVINVFRGIVKAQLLRIRRICTREEDREEAIRILKNT